MQVTSVSPVPNEISVVIGRPIEVVFDKPVDPASVTTATFSLMGPGQTALVDADNLIHKTPDALTGREYITGTFAFPEANKLVFTPGRPLRPMVRYTVMLAGSNSILATNVIKAVGGEKLAQSYTFSFTTFAETAEPLVYSPLLEDHPQIPLDEIRLIPRAATGNNLGQDIEIHFPDLIDLSSLDPSYAGAEAPQDSNPFNDILVTAEALLNDPQVSVPAGLAYVVSISGNVIRVRLAPGA